MKFRSAMTSAVSKILRTDDLYSRSRRALYPRVDDARHRSALLLSPTVDCCEPNKDDCARWNVWCDSNAVIAYGDPADKRRRLLGDLAASRDWDAVPLLSLRPILVQSTPHLRVRSLDHRHCWTAH